MRIGGKASRLVLLYRYIGLMVDLTSPLCVSLAPRVIFGHGRLSSKSHLESHSLFICLRRATKLSPLRTNKLRLAFYDNRVSWATNKQATVYVARDEEIVASQLGGGRKRLGESGPSFHDDTSL